MIQFAIFEVKSAAPEVVSALVPPSGHDVEPLVDLVQELRDLLRNVLKVSVHRNDHVATRVIKSDREFRSLTARIHPEAKGARSGVAYAQLDEGVEGAVPATVVHENNSVGAAGTLEVTVQGSTRLTAECRGTFNPSVIPLEALPAVPHARHSRHTPRRSTRWPRTSPRPRSLPPCSG